MKATSIKDTPYIILERFFAICDFIPHLLVGLSVSYLIYMFIKADLTNWKDALLVLVFALYLISIRKNTRGKTE